MRSPDQIGITWEENQLLMQQLREKAALEHRRQHNIFEVGDKVVFRECSGIGGASDAIDLMTVKSIDAFGVRMTNSLCPWAIQIRHATDEEIKAGRRLSKIKCWSCDKEMSHSDRAENDGFCIHCNAEIEL